MFHRLALAYLVDMNEKLSSKCEMDTSEYTEEFLECIIEDPQEHLNDTQLKFDELINKVTDRDTRRVYYAFYYQGQIDGILNLFNLKRACESGDKKH